MAVEEFVGLPALLGDGDLWDSIAVGPTAQVAVFEAGGGGRHVVKRKSYETQNICKPGKRVNKRTQRVAR